MSEQFLVSARKYRPQTFDTVVGQSNITTTLKNAIRTQQLAHAFLFCGPRGVGKTTCARILAKTINCENPTADIEACGECSTCQSFQNNTSFNVFELDAASNNSVEDIRELTNQVRFAPQHGKYKIYIIDEVHMLSTAAFNAFLKTLEEPPSYAIFILATTEKHKILPTILSRCQVFDFKRITTKSVVDHLSGIATKEHLQAEEEALHMIALKSEGCMRDALSMLDRIASFTNGSITYTNTMEHLNQLDADFYFTLVDHLLSRDVPSTLLALDAIMDKGFEGNSVLEGLAEHFRNILLCKDARMAKLLDVPQAHKAQFFEKAQYTPSPYILSALNELNNSLLEYKNANNKRLHTEMCLIRLCYLNDVIEMVSNDGKNEKKNFRKVASVIAFPGSKSQIQKQPENEYQKQSKLEIDDEFINVKIDSTHEQVAEQNSEPLVKAPTTNINNGGVNFLSKGAGKSSRLSRSLNDLLSAQEKETNNQQQQTREFNQELVLEIYNSYVEHVGNSGKSTFQAMLKDIEVLALPPNSVKFIANNSMTDTFVRGNRDDIMDYFTKELGFQAYIEIVVNEKVQQDNKPIRKSKNEIFQELKQQNPILEALQHSIQLYLD